LAKTQELTKAFAYLRTSSASNVGQDKDSDKRQLAAIESFAIRHGFQIVGTFRDDAVSGEDDISSRPGFSDMLDALEANGTRTVIVEDASRFARKLLVQELGILALLSRQVTCWASAGEVELTNTDDEFKIAMRQVAGAFAQLEKTRLVKKLKVARDRKRATGVKVEGRRSIAEKNPETIQLAIKLNRNLPKGGKLSLRQISAKLAENGHMTRHGNSYSATAVSKMLSNH
jgi:DNA invertase Pin-like site-specific DNA recombinase